MGTLEASTPQGVAAEAQSRPRDTAAAADNGTGGHDGWPGIDRRYRLGRNVDRMPPPPFKRARNDPVYRRLRIYAIDPAASQLAGAVALINVPYEPLQPGPESKMFCVDNLDGARNVRYRRVDLDDKAILIMNGHDPTPSDPRFHQQMVYAVCSNVYWTFKAALGRAPNWGFERTARPEVLDLQPHAFEGANAYYDKERGRLCFGYVRAQKGPATDRTLPGGYVFSCLSHDVVAHELTHAILDGLRANFTVPSGPDVVAFHEAFADLIAIFTHFSYPELVLTAIREQRGDLGHASLLSEIASQLGHATGKRGALRDAVASDGSGPMQYAPDIDSHELGNVLVSAVFEAFLKVLQRKTAAIVRLATGGSGVLAPGTLPVDLQLILANKAAQLASQFVAMLIRAIDYCPPVDLTFGEYLRALITADHELIPEDKFGYREALIDAFLRRNIYPRHVSSLSEDALLWRPTTRPLPPIVALDFGHLRFQGGPGTAAGPEELRRQACALGEYISQDSVLAEFGLVADNDPRLNGCAVDLPTVESIRTTRRIGPDGQVIVDLVAEVVQRCTVPRRGSHKGFTFFGGGTIILGPDGEIRYSICKSVLGRGRLDRRRKFIESPPGSRLWEPAAGQYVVRKEFFALLHEPIADGEKGVRTRRQK